MTYLAAILTLIVTLSDTDYCIITSSGDAADIAPTLSDYATDPDDGIKPLCQARDEPVVCMACRTEMKMNMRLPSDTMSPAQLTGACLGGGWEFDKFPKRMVLAGSS